MEKFESIAQLIERVRLFRPQKWIYANPKTWEKNKKKTIFYYIPENYIQELEDDEIYLDDEGLEMPLNTKGLNLRTWMLVSNFIYILDKSQGSNKKLIEGINYYREYDAFKE